MMMVLMLQSDSSSSYLRAARAGNLDKLVDLLDSGKANITTANAVCTVLLRFITDRHRFLVAAHIQCML